MRGAQEDKDRSSQTDYVFPMQGLSGRIQHKSRTGPPHNRETHLHLWRMPKDLQNQRRKDHAHEDGPQRRVTEDGETGEITG